MIHGRIARKRTAAKRTGCRHRIAGALKLVLMPDVVTTFLTSDPLSRTAGRRDTHAESSLGARHCRHQAHSNGAGTFQRRGHQPHEQFILYVF